MGFTCGGTVTGGSLTELISAVQKHAIEHHDYTEEMAYSPEKVAEWRGAIMSSSRPTDIRTDRPNV
tara:strand:- start:424 stop:621 length:198 start_codon:yes stop_codon:yes gene_type:complete